jgi:hypothetical protein
MIILNFSHPLTSSQLNQIENLAKHKIVKVIDIKVQIDQENPLEPQVTEIVNQVNLNATDWQTQNLLVNLPGYAPVVACIIAEIEGRCGHLPSILKIKPVLGVTTEYEVSEIINLQHIRDKARTTR